MLAKLLYLVSSYAVVVSCALITLYVLHSIYFNSHGIDPSTEPELLGYWSYAKNALGYYKFHSLLVVILGSVHILFYSLTKAANVHAGTQFFFVTVTSISSVLSIIVIYATSNI